MSNNTQIHAKSQAEFLTGEFATQYIWSSNEFQATPANFKILYQTIKSYEWMRSFNPSARFLAKIMGVSERTIRYWFSAIRTGLWCNANRFLLCEMQNGKANKFVFHQFRLGDLTPAISLCKKDIPLKSQISDPCKMNDSTPATDCTINSIDILNLNSNSIEFEGCNAPIEFSEESNRTSATSVKQEQPRKVIGILQSHSEKRSLSEENKRGSFSSFQTLYTNYPKLNRFDPHSYRTDSLSPRQRRFKIVREMDSFQWFRASALLDEVEERLQYFKQIDYDQFKQECDIARALIKAAQMPNVKNPGGALRKSLERWVNNDFNEKFHRALNIVKKS